ncbi:hypothetical protein EDB86DRAFT_2838055 [Lactarius hatsudake]|nr:hypothetical protein EDB86DRAFT_2838055 [Lactarius hatsudake]
MAWGSVVAGALPAMWRVDRVLRDVAGSWRVLGQGGGGVAGRQGLGMPCWVGEVGWWWQGRMEVVHFLQAKGLVRRVGVVRWVGDGRVLGQDGGGLRAQMACNVQGFVCRVGVARRVGGGGVLGWG